MACKNRLIIHHTTKYIDNSIKRMMLLCMRMHSHIKICVRVIYIYICYRNEKSSNSIKTLLGPFSILLGESSDYAQQITRQVTSVTWPVIGLAYSELTPARDWKRALVSCPEWAQALLGQSQGRSIPQPGLWLAEHSLIGSRCITKQHQLPRWSNHSLVEINHWSKIQRWLKECFKFVAWLNISFSFNFRLSHLGNFHINHPVYESYESRIQYIKL